MYFPRATTLEALEARIVPALTVLHPIPDLIPGIGATGASLDLANAFDAAGNFRTHVLFTTNYIDPANPTVPQVIEFELFDDKAPVTVANFLRYVRGLAPSDFDDVFFHRLIPGFVLQGGGFETGSPGTHIATDPEVHNEFNPLDTERSNLVGTVAMAKTGLGPHTGTSEWFVNLGNNAGNLDSQNGGFTVFAKVTQGMNVVNAIAALNRFNLAGSLGGPFTDLPLQNYNADPDGNPATPSPTPTAAQFITITDATVKTPTPASAPGVTYTVQSITDATTLAPTNLVAGAITGQNLALTYLAGANGVAKVTVKASQAGEPDVLEDFLVTLRPNVVAMTTTITPGILVPGEQFDIAVQIQNSGAARLVGNYDVTFYLSRFDAALDPQGTIVQPGVDEVFATLANQSLNLASGGSTSLSALFAVPKQLVQQQGAVTYRIIADVKQVAGGTVTELFTDDNVALNSPQHQLFNAFGTFSGRTNVTLTYLDAATTNVNATVTGGGFGQFDPQGVGDLDRVSVSGTTAASTFTITAGSPTVLDAVFIAAPIGTADLAPVTVISSFRANAGIRTLTVGNLGDGIATHPFSIGAFAADPAQKATITLAQVRDIEFTSAMPIAALTAVSWLDADAEADVITVPAIDSLLLTGDATVNGAFQADISVTGSTPLPLFRISYFDPANQFAILTVNGGGYAHFTPQRGGATGPLEVVGTTALSTLSLVAAGATELDSLSITNVIGSATLSGVNVKGNVEALAGIRALTLGNVGDGTATRTLTIGAFAADAAQRATITLGQVRDVALTSTMPVGAITAASWVDSGGAQEAITAPSITSIEITAGTFDPSVSVTGAAPLGSFKLRYTDAASQPITLTINSGGYAKFAAVGALEVRGTTALSSLSIAGASAAVKTTLTSLLIPQTIGGASLANVILNGDLNAAGGIRTLILGNLGDGTASHSISVGAFTNNAAQKATITLGQVRDFALTSAMPIGALTAVDWLDSNASSELITAPAIDSILISGNTNHRGAFQADLTITGTTKLQSFIVTGTVSTARLQTAGDVGLIRLGALARSEILVGVDTVPRALADFAGKNHRIDTFKILNGSATGIPLIDSKIAAARFGSISVGKVAPNSGTARWGFIADRINSYLVGTKSAFNLAAPAIFDQRTHYAVKIV